MNDTNQRPKAVIFDFNGTMIFDSAIHRAVWLDFIPAHGGVIPEGDFDAMILGRDNAHILRDFLGELSDADIARLTDGKEGEYRRRCVLDAEAFRFVDGLAPFLDALKAAGVPLNIATGSEIKNVNFYFDNLGLSRWFDKSLVVYDDGSFPGKPSPDIYIRASASLKADACDCAVFEDSVSGVASARAAGIGRVIAVGNNVDESRFLNSGGVDAVISNFKSYTLLPGFGFLRDRGDI